ncbi:MAG: hypothetical protein KGL44_12690 [Sphingomonadales bacterium]|nr:hypothetical protein [Sphingomonadales bacterium]
MRKTGLLLLALILSACSSKGEAPGAAEGEEAIECAINGATTFARVCAVDRSRQGNSLVLIVRHPDGGFRRFQVLEDGRGLGAADGAQEPQNKLSGQVLEVTLGEDKYRFPVHTKPDAAK